MPTYDYQCRKCGKKFERSQRITEAALTQCPFCKGRVDRLIGGGGGLIFKGTGFYITDYKKKSPSDASKTSSKPDKPKSGGAKE